LHVIASREAAKQSPPLRGEPLEDSQCIKT